MRVASLISYAYCRRESFPGPTQQASKRSNDFGTKIQIQISERKKKHDQTRESIPCTIRSNQTIPHPACIVPSRAQWHPAWKHLAWRLHDYRQPGMPAETNKHMYVCMYLFDHAPNPEVPNISTSMGLRPYVLHTFTKSWLMWSKTRCRSCTLIMMRFWNISRPLRIRTYSRSILNLGLSSGTNSSDVFSNNSLGILLNYSGDS